jgi:hypothetical protein
MQIFSINVLAIPSFATGLSNHFLPFPLKTKAKYLVMKSVSKILNLGKIFRPLNGIIWKDYLKSILSLEEISTEKMSLK